MERGKGSFGVANSVFMRMRMGDVGLALAEKALCLITDYLRLPLIVWRQRELQRLRVLVPS